VLIPAQYLVDRLRGPKSRADQVRELRRRLLAQADARRASPDERALASQLRRLREALAKAFRDVEACSGCARGYPLPHGRWQGGHCCGGRTEYVFTDEELGALRLSGTTPERFVPPRSDHAGCAFRGPTGCSLDVGDRPNICVRYVCRELHAELDTRGRLSEITDLESALRETFRRFVAARAERLENEMLRELAETLA
jgi:hypothetical protein